MHTYVNFGANEMKMKRVVTEASTIMSNIAAQVCGKNMDSLTRQRFTTWFGDPRGGSLGRVQEVISRMATCLTRSSIRIKYKAGNAGTYAEALAGNKADSYKMLSKDTYKLTIYEDFWKLKIYADQKNNDLSKMDDSQMETFFHELSHLAGGTEDEATAAGDKAYGSVNARLLITEDLTRARNNADNYGFFCMAMGRHRGF